MDSKEATESIRELGFCIIPNVLSESEVDSYCELVDSLSGCISKRDDPKVKEFHGDSANVQVINNLHSKDIRFWDLIAHPLVTEIADVLLTEGSYQDKEPYQLSTSQARSITGPENSQQLHIDSRLPGGNFALSLVAGWALTPFTASNGATRFVPGSHKRSYFPPSMHSEESEYIAECNKGSLVIFNSSLWHGSSKKIDHSVRTGLFFNYNRWFMRQNFKINRSTPKQFHNQLTEKMIQISGAYYEEPLDESIREVRISKSPQW